MQNYIPLSHPHYIHHAIYIQKLDKPMSYVMIGSEVHVRELLWEILFANQKSGISGVFCDLGSSVLLQKVLAY